MKDTCNEMRLRIESSIGLALDPGEREEIERHCAQCEECRVYREHLLGDDSLLTEFAAPCSESVRRVQEGAIESLRAAGSAAAHGIATEPNLQGASRSNKMIRRIPRIATIAAAAAAVIIGLFVIDLIRGVRNGPVPLFAAVQEKMQKCDNVSYRLSEWRRGKWTAHTEATTSSWFLRKDYGDSIIVWDFGNRKDRNEVTELRLYPAERRAVIGRRICSTSNRGVLRPEVQNPADRLAAWHKAKGFSYVRKERLNGVNTAVYEKSWKLERDSSNAWHESYPSRGAETHRLTAWVDLETELPVRLEMVPPQSDRDSDRHPYGLLLSDFRLGSSRAPSWIDLKPGKPNVIYDDFKWNFSPDTYYFSTTPPAGYATVETSLPGSPDTCRTEGEAAAKILVGAFSRWLSISGNVFPMDVADLSDSAKVKPLLFAKYRRGGDPGDEYRAASEAVEELEIFAASCTSMVLRPQFDVNYVGKGADFGNSKRIICLVKDKNKPRCPGRSGNGPYFCIYGDLHVAASTSPPR
jgi:hypothetical protein